MRVSAIRFLVSALIGQILFPVTRHSLDSPDLGPGVRNVRQVSVPEPEGESVPVLRFKPGSAKPLITGSAFTDTADADIQEFNAGELTAYYTGPGDQSLTNVGQATSTNAGKTWTLGAETLPQLPDFAQRGQTWAPVVTHVADGTYVLYTAVLMKGAPESRKVHCIAIATAKVPSGPFIAEPKPMICDELGLGFIDPSVTIWQGKKYLLYKMDGNTLGQESVFYIQRLSADGKQFVDQPREILRSSTTTIERPRGYEVRTGDRSYFMLIFAAGDFDDTSYHESFRVAPSPFEPFMGGGPVLTSDNTRVTGPGTAGFMPQAIGPDGVLTPGDKYLYGQSITSSPGTPLTRDTKSYRVTIEFVPPQQFEHSQAASGLTAPGF